MDVDGFDPYEDEYEWRDALEVMGEEFQEKLAAKGLTRRFRKLETVPRPLTEEEAQERGLVPPPIDPPSVTDWLDDDWVPKPEPFRFTGF